MGSIGNDAVDKLAKTSATRGSSHPNSLPPIFRNELPISLSATKQLIDKLTKMNIKTWWRGSTRYKRMREIDPTLPSANFIKATSGLNRRQISVLTQLRTGHAPLNKHLHRSHKPQRQPELQPLHQLTHPKTSNTSSSTATNTHYKTQASHEHKAKRVFNPTPPFRSSNHSAHAQLRECHPPIHAHLR